MAKDSKSIFLCQECGYESAKWMGQCPSCHAWNSFAEEILSTNEYPRMIKCCDRATILNLMIGSLGYTLCSGIICEELNGSEYIAVPYEADEENPNSVMEIGYIALKSSMLSQIGERYVDELKRYLETETKAGSVSAASPARRG